MMNRLLFVLVLIVVAVAGLAYYLGWFDVTVDKAKIQEDKNNAAEWMQDAGESSKDKSKAPIEQKREQAAPRSDAHGETGNSQEEQP